MVGLIDVETCAFTLIFVRRSSSSSESSSGVGRRKRWRGSALSPQRAPFTRVSCLSRTRSRVLYNFRPLLSILLSFLLLFLSRLWMRNGEGKPRQTGSPVTDWENRDSTLLLYSLFSFFFSCWSLSLDQFLVRLKKSLLEWYFNTDSMDNKFERIDRSSFGSTGRSILFFIIDYSTIIFHIFDRWNEIVAQRWFDSIDW